MDGGRLEEALPLLEEIFFLYPERSDYAQALARCQLILGLTEAAEATLEACLEGFGETETAHLIRAQLRLDHGDVGSALGELEQVKARAPRDLQLLTLLARALLRCSDPISRRGAPVGYGRYGRVRAPGAVSQSRRGGQRGDGGLAGSGRGELRCADQGHGEARSAK